LKINPITESDGLQDIWYAQAREQRLDTLEQFIGSMLEPYEHDDSTLCHAMAAAMLAAMWAVLRHPKGQNIGQVREQLLCLVLEHAFCLSGRVQIEEDE